MPVGPRHAVVVKDAIDRIGFRIERQIVKAEIAMNENAVAGTDHHGLIAFDGTSHDNHEIVVVHYAG